MKILIVEDEEIQRLSLRDDLRDAAYETTAVASPTAALELIEKEPFDVVLTDLKIPGMDGITLLKRIKKIQSNATVIMMTAHGTFESAQQAMELGAYAYLTKPFRVNELLMLLKQVHSKTNPVCSQTA